MEEESMAPTSTPSTTEAGRAIMTPLVFFILLPILDLSYLSVYAGPERQLEEVTRPGGA